MSALECRVVSALKIVARVRLDCNSAGFPLPPRHDVVDLERGADAEQQRQRDDVGEIRRQVDEDARLGGFMRVTARAGYACCAVASVRQLK
jgi:hypothetical protein